MCVCGRIVQRTDHHTPINADIPRMRTRGTRTPSPITMAVRSHAWSVGLVRGMQSVDTSKMSWNNPTTPSRRSFSPYQACHIRWNTIHVSFHHRLPKPRFMMSGPSQCKNNCFCLQMLPGTLQLLGKNVCRGGALTMK